MKLVAHELPGTVQARFHRLFAKAERTGGLLDAELLDHAQHEHHTEQLGQVVDRTLQQVTHLAPGGGPLRIELRGEMRHGNDPASGHAIRQPRPTAP